MQVAMLGPALDAMGGISSVARAWLDSRAMAEVDLTYIPTMTTAGGTRRFLGMAKRQAAFVARVAGGWRPDLFHIHTSSYVSFYRKLAYFTEARTTGAPVLLHLHGSDMADFHEAGGVHRRALVRALLEASAVVCLSEAMARDVTAWTGGRARVEVVYNPVDLGQFTSPPRPARDRPTVLFMGLIGQRKGTWDLLEAVPAVLQAVPGARFRFGGNGEVDRLREEVARQGLQESVEILGWVSGEDKLRHFAEADVYCLPSYNEGLPMSILEAMGDSLPVVSTPIAGIPEAVVEGETGHLVAPGDVAALARALSALLAEPARAATMGAAGRARAERLFDAEVVARRVVDLWTELSVPPSPAGAAAADRR